MLKKLNNRLWVRPQLFILARLSSSSTIEEVDVPTVILTKKGAAALALGFINFIFYELFRDIFDKCGRMAVFEESDRAALFEDYIENNGFIKSGISSADRYYYLKHYIDQAHKYINSRPDECYKTIDSIKRKTKQAEEMLEELYKDALILQLAGVEKV